MEINKKEMQLVQLILDRINRYGGLADDGKELLVKINFELLKRDKR